MDPKLFPYLMLFFLWGSMAQVTFFISARNRKRYGEFWALVCIEIGLTVFCLGILICGMMVAKERLLP